MAGTPHQTAELADMSRRIGADSNILDGFACDLFAVDETRARDVMEISKQMKGIARWLAQIADTGARD